MMALYVADPEARFYDWNTLPSEVVPDMPEPLWWAYSEVVHHGGEQIEFAGWMKLMAPAEILELLASTIPRYVSLFGKLPEKAEAINRTLAAVKALDPGRQYGLVAYEVMDMGGS